MSKRKTVKSFKSDTVPPKSMILRMVSVREDTANDETKSVEVVIASENPVERYDETRGDVIQEILAMDGVQFRNPNKRQLPIVDSHNRETVRNVLGSVRNVRVEGSELVGDAMFARDSDSQNAFDKLKDGHLIDFSITATPTEIQSIQRGEVAVFNGSEIVGPVDIVSKWTPTDASLVAVGADETSTVRSALLRSYNELTRKAETMEEEVKEKLVAHGMDENATVEEALRFAIEKMDAPAEVVEDVVEEVAEEVAEEVEKMDAPDDEVEKMDDE